MVAPLTFHNLMLCESAVQLTNPRLPAKFAARQNREFGLRAYCDPNIPAAAKMPEAAFALTHLGQDAGILAGRQLRRPTQSLVIQL
jgi:hypothetical protein